MTAHVITIDTDGNKPTTMLYRWCCSCRAVGRRWFAKVRSARTGGERHVAAMERGA